MNKGLFKGVSNSQSDRRLGSGDVVLSLTKQKYADFVDMRAETITGARGIRFGTVRLNNRYGDEAFAQYATAPAFPGGTSGVAASMNGQFMAVVHSASPYVTIYEISGTTFTKLSNPLSLPTGIGRGVSFSPNGQFMAVGHDSSPYVTIYEISGTTFTKLSNPSSLPTSTGYGVSFSPNGQLMAVAHNTSPYVTIYEISGTTFTKLSNPATLPAGVGRGVAFSPNGQFMAVAHSTSPYVTIYAIGASEFTKVFTPLPSPSSAAGQGVTFSYDSKLFMNTSNTVYKTTYTNLDRYPINLDSAIEISVKL